MQKLAQDIWCKTVMKNEFIFIAQSKWAIENKVLYFNLSKYEYLKNVYSQLLISHKNSVNCFFLQLQNFLKLSSETNKQATSRRARESTKKV